ncbi:hypothetical protein GCM10009733_048740 [Nonomuraea maheshkhaliensis]|uniref:Uncharacterized protein n=1 Tax=Nonomuraea maheshkhaliensis TaxID=419590 RepID=A0ABN2FGR3_9ACTN
MPAVLGQDFFQMQLVFQGDQGGVVEKVGESQRILHPRETIRSPPNPVPPFPKYPKSGAVRGSGGGGRGENVRVRCGLRRSDGGTA